MLNCHDIANYFLALARADEDAGEDMTNLKLQKLVYYAQGIGIAYLGKPLFNESIEAWTHGPVVPELYSRFKGSGATPISFNEEIDLTKYDEKTKEVLDDVYRVFAQYSGWKLRNMTHDDAPWRDTERGEEITHGSLKEYFKSFVE